MSVLSSAEALERALPCISAVVHVVVGVQDLSINRSRIAQFDNRKLALFGAMTTDLATTDKARHCLVISQSMSFIH
jgi:hypothetical protein